MTQTGELDNRRVVRTALEIFGFDRAMFASNYPVASLRIGFQDQVKAIWSMVADATQAERADLFHNTAARYYGLEVNGLMPLET